MIISALLNYLVENKIIPINQQGFMPKQSYTTLITSVINKWQRLLDSHPGGHIHAISIDWEKAFVLIPHSRLLLKLCKIGVNGVLLKWFKNYLTCRKQRVLLNGSISALHNVSSGVIQGSVLGPLLFNTFMTDLPTCVLSPLITYADDSTIYRYIDSYDDEVCLQQDLNNIQNWCIDNGMRNACLWTSPSINLGDIVFTLLMAD
jgi:ribonuclease P/MRP protein subunit RPP40